MKSSSTFILLLLLLVPLFVLSQDILPKEVRDEIKYRVDNLINPSINVGIVDENGYHYYSFGSRTLGGEKVDEHTIYEIGSITKVFTGILLAQQVENGNLSLDDPIGKFLPEIKVPQRNGKEITLGNLSDHTSGLPRLPDNMNPADPENPYADYTVEMLYQFLSSYELRRDIGAQYEYSNLAQGLLGHILALYAGSSYEKIMLDRIARPLDMNETKITFDLDMLANLAIGYDMGMQAKNWDIPTLAGAGAIRSSVYDMLKFMEVNLGLKESKLYSSMRISHKERHHKGGNRVGLGWHISNGAEGDVIWHNGGTGGYRAFAGFNQAKLIGVVVLTNSTESVDDIGFRLLNSSARLRDVKPSIASVLREKIDNIGVNAAVRTYHKTKEKNANEYDFGEGPVNLLGYHYLRRGNLKAALALFKLNVEAYPNSSNAYDSYGEALMKDGQKDLAIENYEKSLELNPGNGNAVKMLKRMGVEPESAEVEVPEEILESYVGKYQLAPGFILEISREGNRLFGQATGQTRVELFAKSKTEFFLKVVDAQIHFKVVDEKVESLTLFQSGQEVIGKKME